MEIPGQKTLEAGAVAGLVTGHFVDRIVNGVVALLLGPLGDIGLSGAGAVFRLNPHLQVLFGTGVDNFAQKLGEFGGVFRLLKGIAPVGFGDLRVTFPLGNPAHGQVHAYLGTFPVKVGPEIVLDILIHVFGNSYNMLGGESSRSALFLEF
jgi:hypothetical protein